MHWLTALVGMAGAIGECDMAVSAIFLLAFQLVGIHLAGAAVFRLYGLTPAGARYVGGRPWVARTAAALGVAALAALMVWQCLEQPNLQRSSRAQRSLETIKRVVTAVASVRCLKPMSNSPAPTFERPTHLLSIVYVRRMVDDLSEAEIRRRLTARIRG